MPSTMNRKKSVVARERAASLDSAHFSDPTHVCIVGSGGVGKSAMAVSFVTKQFVSSYDPTVEDSYRKQIIIDDEVAYLDLFDTAGQVDYESLRPQWYQAGQAFVIVYSICEYRSFLEALETYKAICDIKGVAAVPAVLVGAKTDLDRKRCVTTQEAKDAARKLGIPHIETSSKTGANVEHAFATLIRLLRQHERGVRRRSTLTSLSNLTGSNGGCKKPDCVIQ